MADRRWFLQPAVWAAALICAAALLGLSLAAPAPITAVDQEQPRLDQAAPLIQGTAILTQTFVARHNGLSAIELLAVVYPQAPLTATLTAQLLSTDGRVLAAQTFAHLQHNASLRLAFSPLADSANQHYRLVLSGSAHSGISVWAYSLDGYTHGDLQLAGQPLAGDLRFTTTYTLLWPDVVRWLVQGLGRGLLLAGPLWLILFAPGLLLLDLLGWDLWGGSSWARWGGALALSLSILPLAWQWTTVAGWHWSPLALAIFYGGIGAALFLRAFRRWRREGWPRWQWTGHSLALGLVLLVGLAVRGLAIRDLVLPAWVDSSHHYLIARLLAETGQVPASYRPLLPVDQFTYHFGFHVIAVAAQWLTALSLTEVFLILGQILNALMPLAVYAFVLALTARPRAALAAAALVGWVSLFPAYYTSWGRYTQLTGLLILAPLLGVLWRLVAGGSARLRWPLTLSAAILASGLAFTHYRVLFFFATFVWAALALGRAGGWKWVSVTALFAIALSAPWLARLGEQWILPLLMAPARLGQAASANDFPIAYFQSPLESAWLGGALLAAGWGLWRRARPVWVLLAWLAATTSVLNLGWGSWVVNNNAWAITLFMPMAGLAGWGVDAVWAGAQHLLQRPASRLRWALGLGLAAALAGGLAWAGSLGLRGQVAILNPATLLATADDRVALDWAAQNLPPEAVVLVNSWNWQGLTWAGSDGGAWLWPLTGRRTTMPPVDYVFQTDWEARVRSFNERLAQITDFQGPEALALLRESGVTHIFVGARGGVLRPELLLRSDHYRLLYTNGAAWIFQVRSLVGP